MVPTDKWLSWIILHQTQRPFFSYIYLSMSPMQYTRPVPMSRQAIPDCTCLTPTWSPWLQGGIARGSQGMGDPGQSRSQESPEDRLMA